MVGFEPGGMGATLFPRRAPLGGESNGALTSPLLFPYRFSALTSLFRWL